MTLSTYVHCNKMMAIKMVALELCAMITISVCYGSIFFSPNIIFQRQQMRIESTTHTRTLTRSQKMATTYSHILKNSIQLFVNRTNGNVRLDEWLKYFTLTLGRRHFGLDIKKKGTHVCAH